MAKKRMTSEEKALRMGTQKMLPLVFTMALPAVCANLSSAIYNIVDRIFMGSFVGNNALGAIALTSPLISVMAGLSLLITIGGAALLSMNLGKKNYEEASRLFTNILVQALVTSFCLSVIYFVFAPQIVKLCGADEASALYLPAQKYLRIIAFGLMFQLLNAVQASIIRAEGSPTYSMCVSIVGGLLNIVLDALLVVGFDMGLEGAAYATVASQMVSAGASSLYFLRGKSIVKWRGFRELDIRQNLAIMKNGAAPATLQLLIFLTGILANNSLRKYGDLWMTGGGDLAISAMSVISTSETLCHTVIMGINQGTTPIISYNYGAKKYDRAISATLIAQAVAFVPALLTWLLMMGKPEWLFALFASKEAGQMMEYGCRAMRLSKLFLLFSGIQTLSSMFFSAIGQPRMATVMSVVKQALFLVPCMVLLPLAMGIDGVLLAYSLSDICSVVIIGILYMKGLKEVRQMGVQNGEGFSKDKSARAW